MRDTCDVTARKGLQVVVGSSFWKMPKDRYGDQWSRDELILALYLYCQVPFSKTKANNPEVRKLADLIGRTPASVARKLGNFGAFDPHLTAQGISGLVHASRADRMIWEEFHDQWEKLVDESDRLLTALSAPTPDTQDQIATIFSEDEEIIARPIGPSERVYSLPVRLFQSFFRRTVLASYDSVCCVCGLDIRSLLVASHIKPWSVDVSVRSEPENGLCLCAIHDRAFDKGFLTVSDQLNLIVTSDLMSSRQHFVQIALLDFHGRALRLPRRFAPRKEFLEWHREHVFKTTYPG